jgi:hypothetical protein
MGMAQLVVTAVLVESRSKSEVARTYRVSRRWVIELVQRFLPEGDAGLVPRSRRPRKSPQRTAQAVEDEIIALRKELDRDGHEAGAATIAAHLQRRHGPDAVPAGPRSGGSCPPAESSPHNPTNARKAAGNDSPPNSRTNAGNSTSPTTDSPTARKWKSSTSSNHSRLCVASTARRVFTAGDVNTVFTTATSEHGDPAGLLSDTGRCSPAPHAAAAGLPSS